MLQRAVQGCGFAVESSGWTRTQLLDAIYAELCRRERQPGEALFIHGFPREQAAYAGSARGPITRRNGSNL